MANDWLKVEKETPDKPEILALAGLLNLHPDEIFGKCFRIWRWADSHTVDGNAPSVTEYAVDRLVSQPGFAQALSKVGWLVSRNGHIVIPNFDRHMGQSAKRRALTKDRVERTRQKGGDRCNARSVTEALPELELDSHIRARGRPSSGPSPPSEPSAAVSSSGPEGVKSSTVTEVDRRAAFDAMSLWSRKAVGTPLVEESNDYSLVARLLEVLSQDAPIIRGEDSIPAQRLAAQAATWLRENGKDFKTLKYANTCVRNALDEWRRKGVPGSGGGKGSSHAPPQTKPEFGKPKIYG